MIKQQEVYLFSDNGRYKFSSKFDNGNMEKVNMIAPTTFEIFTGTDQYNSNPNPKNWFHFSVSGLPPSQRIYFIIRRVNLLWPLYNNDIESYRPVFKVEGQDWKRLPELEQVNLNNAEQDRLDLHFSYTPALDQQEVFFAFTYPYSYSQYQHYIEKLENFEKEGIYCQVETIIRSVQDRSTHLITISSTSKQQPQSEVHFDFKLFPENKMRPPVFKKPVVLITARVHPGESPSSYVAEGIIDYLLNSETFEANLLRETFVFLIIPMLNPDGVYSGNYRLDPQGNNLNRYYKNLTPESHPTIFAVKSLITYLGKRLVFYIDLHAHASQKSTFLYGNALDDFPSQIQNQIFSKQFANNCLVFDPKQCNFSKKQMQSKDTYELMTKEGCGRVVVNNITGVINSYTLECGYHNNQNNKNPNELIENNPQLYAQIGQDLLITILDAFGLADYKNNYLIEQNKLRSDVAIEVSKIERFRQFQNVKYLKTINPQIEVLIKKIFANFIEQDFKTQHISIKQKQIQTRIRVNCKSGVTRTYTNPADSQTNLVQSLQNSLIDPEKTALKRLMKTEYLQPRMLNTEGLDQNFLGIISLPSNISIDFLISQVKHYSPRMKKRSILMKVVQNYDDYKIKQFKKSRVVMKKNSSQLIDVCIPNINEKQANLEQPKYTEFGQEIYRNFLKTTAQYDRLQGITTVYRRKQSRQQGFQLSEIQRELFCEGYEGYEANSSRQIIKQNNKIYNNRLPDPPQPPKRVNISQGNILPIIRDFPLDSIKKLISFEAKQSKFLGSQYVKQKGKI